MLVVSWFYFPAASTTPFSFAPFQRTIVKKAHSGNVWDVLRAGAPSADRVLLPLAEDDDSSRGIGGEAAAADKPAAGSSKSKRKRKRPARTPQVPAAMAAGDTAAD